MTPREIAKKNGDLIYEGEPCKKGGHTAHYTNDNRCAGCKKKYYYENREKILKQKQQWSRENREKIAERDKIRYQNNKEQIIKQKGKYYKKRYHNDELFRVKEILRSQLKSFCNTVNGKKEGRTHELLGYTAVELKTHLESLFKEGMTWDNQGKWHIDHRIPQSYFTSIDQMRECFALDNLKPEWAEWNKWKSNRFIG